MVRCSIKRAIKTLISLSILLILVYRHFPSSNRTDVNQVKRNRRSPSIVIVAVRTSRAIQRLILFLQELRLPYVQYSTTDERFYHQITIDLPSALILDHQPGRNLATFVQQHRISLLIYLNDQCKACVVKTYSQMLHENVSYPTIDFHRDDLQPIVRTTKSPFRVEESNGIVRLLRFKRLLPYFHHHPADDDRCHGFGLNPHEPFETIIYVRDRITLEKLHLMVVSDRQIQLSACLDHHWFVWPLVMDSLKYLTSGLYDHHGFDRHIQVDIDDIFLGGKSQDHLKPADIQALLRSQTFIQTYAPNFCYRLGFSGYYFNTRNTDDGHGDQLLIQEKDKFLWFHHTWKHQKLTQVNDAIALFSSTRMNLAFAEKHKLPMDLNYAVAPHHTGIYPINPTVYDVWHRLLNFTVTSTENYPYHYNAPSNRRGFVYRGLSVLPRQSCGLYTTTRNYTTYPNGSDRLEQYLMGGRLFRRILTSPISIFMTHNVNYGHDRLGNYLFSKLIYQISTWTRLQFSPGVSSRQLARTYFEDFYPEEQMPVFTNPCDDRILMELWMGNRSLCRFWPQFLIVGPQKTGTTALHAMLRQHPDLRPSKQSLATYEEVQFFSNDTLYLQGIEWYLNRFDTNNGQSSSSMTFEKSATYFDSKQAMKRIRALLPNVRLIMILTEPGARAYSRYQHEVARSNTTISFDLLLRINDDQQSENWHLRQRCLHPGHYAEYIRQWLSYFPAKQISIIDGDAFRRDPRPILKDIQSSVLQLETPIESSKLVRFNRKKGFFCPISDTNHTQCLGNSKGRPYEKMSADAREYLNTYYSSHNKHLIEVLRENNYPIPRWLSDTSK